VDVYLHSPHTSLWRGTWLSKSRGSSVGIALGYGLDDRGSRVRFPAGAGNFSLHHRVRTALGPTQPPIHWVHGALSPGGKAAGT
jgi:hypothetical protein